MSLTERTENTERTRHILCFLRCLLFDFSILTASALLACGCAEKKQPMPCAPAAPARQAEASPPFVAVPGDPGVYLFDTGKPSDSLLPDSDVDPKRGWIFVPSDVTEHEFKGDAVFLNNRFAVVVRKAGVGAEVYCLAPSGAAYRARIAPSRAGALPKPGTAFMKIADNTPGAVCLDCAYAPGDGEMRVSFRAAAGGDTGVEVVTGAGLDRIAVESKMYCAVAPEFFADDMVFGSSYRDFDRILMPAENFFLGMLADGACVMMCVWQTQNLDAEIVYDGDGADRSIARAELQAVPKKSLWIMFLDGADAWAARDAGAGPQWKPPFAARWRLNFIKPTALSESVAFEPGTLASRKHEQFVVYPLERHGTTPLDRYCM